MTTKIVSNRDERALAAIKTVVDKELAGRPIERVIVTPRDNHSGEPAFYVTVVVASEKDVPQVSEQNRLVVRMIEELEQLDDDRFPYLHFGYSYAEDGRWVELSPTSEDV
jgi:hypothetical protein